MSSASPPPHSGQPHGLVRQFGLLQATALNMSNMIGIGPFITIPLLMTALTQWLIAIDVRFVASASRSGAQPPSGPVKTPAADPVKPVKPVAPPKTAPKRKPNP